MARAVPLDADEALRLYHDVGLCLRTIARRLGVNEKRVSAIVRADPRPTRRAGQYCEATKRRRAAAMGERIAAAGNAELAYSPDDPDALRAAYQRLVDGLSSMGVECRRAGVCNSTLNERFRRLGLPPRARGLPGVLPGTILMRATCLDPEVEAQLVAAIKRDRAAVMAAERVRAMRRREEGLAA